MNRLREMRNEKGITLKQLSDALKSNNELSLSPDTLSKYEREEREPKRDTWLKLADYFHVSIAYMMGISDSKSFTKIVPQDKKHWKWGIETDPVEFVYDARMKNPNSLPVFLNDIINGSPVVMDNSMTPLPQDKRELLNNFIRALLKD